MERTERYLPNFGVIETRPLLDFAAESVRLSYWVILTAMRGFTFLAIPIWLFIVALLSTISA